MNYTVDDNDSDVTSSNGNNYNLHLPPKNTCCYAVIGSIVIILSALLVIYELPYFTTDSPLGNTELLDAFLICPIVPLIIAGLLLVVVKCLNSATRMYIAAALAISACATSFLSVISILLVILKISTPNSTESVQTIVSGFAFIYIAALAGSLIVCCTSCIGLSCPDLFCCHDNAETGQLNEINYIGNSNYSPLATEASKILPMSQITYV